MTTPGRTTPPVARAAVAGPGIPPPAPMSLPPSEAETRWHHMLARALAAAMTLLALGWSFDLHQRLGYAFLSEQFYALVLGLGLAVAFLTIGIHGRRVARVSVIDAAIAFFALGVLIYVSINFLHLRDLEYANSTALAIGIGAVLTVLVLEGLRRTSGLAILLVVLVFLAYGPLGHLVPGPLVGAQVPPWRIASNMGFNSDAIFGTPIKVATTVIIIFILFGQILFRAGGGQFFTDIAMAAMGRRRGGAAKIAVMGSAAFGSVSGSAISNVVTTGIITIPLMRRAGYNKTQAGAIESVASTGGQLMPPIMGAAAFLMAEFLQMPYTQVMIAAIIPALLYYFAVFVQVDLIAGRDRISVVEDEIPRARDVMKRGWHFVAPFLFLIYALFFWNMRPETAAIYCCGLMFLLGALIPYNGQRIRFRDIYRILYETGGIVVDVLLMVAAAGIVIGVLNLTGLGFALTYVLMDVAGGNMWILLLFTAIICIILGMGLPTAAAYVLLAALAAPALVEAGVPPIAAHMFILYFGMMSMITPPIALAAFAAASLTKANPMATGFQAMSLGWVAYVVPFAFVAAPSLLLNGTPLEVGYDVMTAAFGAYLVSVAFVGFFMERMGVPMRLLFAVLGFLALKPATVLGGGNLVNPAAVAIGAVLLLLLYRRAKAAERTSPELAPSMPTDGTQR